MVEKQNEPVTDGAHTVVGLGEALFDCFPGRKALGGAPLNMAYHADQLLDERGCGVVASRIGNDELGSELLQEMNARSLSTEFVQRDPQAATGQVHVTLSDSGEPAYDIIPNVAWDNLDFESSFRELATRCTAVCFGTLAQRGERSRSTIEQFVLNAKSAVRMFDVNLRQQYYSPEVLESSLRAANTVKLNEHELSRVCGLLGTSPNAGDVDACALALCDTFKLNALAVTRGAEGTLLYRGSERFEAAVPGYDRAPNADSVGAGDACCAALVVGTLLSMPPEDIVALANHAGAFVASRSGATPTMPDEILAMVPRDRG